MKPRLRCLCLKNAGSDDCWWDHQCDLLEPEQAVCPYSDTVADNEQFCPDTQSTMCADICLPFTPNGCDCFGCCTFPELTGLGEDGEDAYVWIGSKDADNTGICTFEDILDTEKCPRCTPVGNCLNTCDVCEICIGKPLPPPECFTDDQCPPGVEPCNILDADPCGPSAYCISGCCQTNILLN